MLGILVKIARRFDSAVTVEFRNGQRWAYYEAVDAQAAAGIRWDLAAAGIRNWRVSVGPGVVVQLDSKYMNRYVRGG